MIFYIFLLLVSIGLSSFSLVASSFFVIAVLVIVRLRYGVIPQYLFLIAILHYIFVFIVTRVYTGTANLIGIVIKSEENYYVLATIKGRLYISLKDNSHNLFEIVRVKGTYIKLGFSHYQESFRFDKYLNSLGVYNSFFVEEEKVIVPSFFRIKELKEVIFNKFDNNYSSFIQSLLYKESLNSLEIYDELRSLGLDILFKTSSLHITFFVSVLRKYLTRVFSEKKVEIGIFIYLLFVLIMSEFNISIFRIFVMYFLNVLIMFKKIDKLDYLSKLSISGIAILLLYPTYVLSISFYYTYVVLFSLNFRMVLIKKRASFERLKIIFIVILSVLPLNLYSSSTFNVTSIVFQIIITPLGSFMYLIDHLAYLSFFTAPFLTRVNYIYIKFLLALCKLNLTLVCGDFNIYFVFIYYFIFFTFIFLTELRFMKFRNVSLIVLISLTSLTFMKDIGSHYEVHFIDVGQGDATLIRYERTNVLVDTGGNLYIDLAKECLIKYFNRLKIEKIDAVFLTHLDYDHYGALNSLVENFEVGEVYYPYERDIEYDVNGFKIVDINRFKDSKKDTNYNSAVFKFQIKETSFLLMGDAPIEIENKLMSYYKDYIDVDVLKLGHHGSDTSSSYNFLKAVNPKEAIISSGYNNYYNHPSNYVLSYLNNLGIAYWRTDLDGTRVIKI